MNELTAYYLLGSGKGFTAIATIAADMSSQAKVMFKKKYKIDAEICETILTLSVDDIVTEPRFLVSSRIKHKA
ncbi:MAG: hypothetical protein P8J32_04720 [bacterium]|nr:hypothetical protein [bacterium]